MHDVHILSAWMQAMQQVRGTQQAGTQCKVHNKCYLEHKYIALHRVAKSFVEVILLMWSNTIYGHSHKLYYSRSATRHTYTTALLAATVILLYLHAIKNMVDMIVYVIYNICATQRCN